jgi:chromate reductase
MVYRGMGALPHFNPDDDPDGGPVPAAVADLRFQLGVANTVLFGIPEYAGSLPGSFKNLLDWTVGGSEIYGKPVAWINASSRANPDAGSGAHVALRTALGYTGANIVEHACRRSAFHTARSGQRVWSPIRRSATRSRRYY